MNEGSESLLQSEMMTKPGATFQSVVSSRSMKNYFSEGSLWSAFFFFQMKCNELFLTNEKERIICYSSEVLSEIPAFVIGNQISFTLVVSCPPLVMNAVYLLVLSCLCARVQDPSEINVLILI